MPGSGVTQPMFTRSAKPKRHRVPRGLVQGGMLFAFAMLGLVLVLVIAFVGYQLIYRGKIHQGVSVWNLDLGGLSKAEAESALKAQFNDFSQTPWE